MKQLLILLLAVTTLSSCGYMFGKRVRGNGNIKTTEHSVSSFKNVEVSGAIDLYVSQGDTKPVRIETDDNLQQYIMVAQQGDRVIIKTKEGYNLRPTGKIKAYVSATVYNSIDVSGACNIIGENKIVNTESMDLEVTGAGSIRMEANAPAIKADVSGAGDVDLKGETKDFDLTLTGAGKAHCFDLKAETTKVDISGAGDADVFASMKLQAEVSGAGHINYKGGATNVEQHVSGAGSVRKAE